MSWKALIEKDPDVLCNPDLRPQTTKRKVDKPTGLEQKILGSTVLASWPEIVGFAIYALTLYLIFHFLNVDELMAEKIENFDRLVEISQSLANTALVVVSFLVGASVFGAASKYATGIQVQFDIADAIGTFILHIFSMTCRDKVNTDICTPYYTFPNDCWQNDLKRQPTRVVKKRKAVHLLEDIQDIMRALAFAFKHNARTQTARSSFDSNIDADVDLEDSSVDPRKLPMMEHLIAEVFVQDTDYLTGLLNMASKRVKLLIEHGVLLDEFEAPMVHINAVGTQVSIISALQVLGLFPALVDLLTLAIYIVFLFLPFPLWVNLGFFGLIVYYVELILVFGLYRFGRKIGNPYNRFDTSPYIYHDLGGIARDIAANVDNQMDTLIGEAIAFRDTNVLCGEEERKFPPKNFIQSRLDVTNTKNNNTRSSSGVAGVKTYSDSDYHIDV